MQLYLLTKALCRAFLLKYQLFKEIINYDLCQITLQEYFQKS